MMIIKTPRQPLIQNYCINTYTIETITRNFSLKILFQYTPFILTSMLYFTRHHKSTINIHIVHNKPLQNKLRIRKSQKKHIGTRIHAQCKNFRKRVTQRQFWSSALQLSQKVSLKETKLLLNEK